jgi:hypothetical protein
VTGWTTIESGFNSYQGQEIFFFAASRLALEPTLASYPLKEGGLFVLG